MRSKVCSAVISAENYMSLARLRLINELDTRSYNIIICESKILQLYFLFFFQFSVCSLVNCLKPGSVSKINKTTMAFKCMENISSFLNVAANMGVPAQETFQTVDLWERQNLNSVVTCLQSLGRKVQCFYCFVNLVSGCGRSLLPFQTSGS